MGRAAGAGKPQLSVADPPSVLGRLKKIAPASSLWFASVCIQSTDPRRDVDNLDWSRADMIRLGLASHIQESSKASGETSKLTPATSGFNLIERAVFGLCSVLMVFAGTRLGRLPVFPLLPLRCCSNLQLKWIVQLLVLVCASMARSPGRFKTLGCRSALTARSVVLLSVYPSIAAASMERHAQGIRHLRQRSGHDDAALARLVRLR